MCESVPARDVSESHAWCGGYSHHCKEPRGGVPAVVSVLPPCLLDRVIGRHLGVVVDSGIRCVPPQCVTTFVSQG